MKILFTYVFVILIFSVGKSQFKDTTYFRVTDFNQDGYIDTITTVEHCCYQSSDYYLTNGKSGQKIQFFHAFSLKESKADFLNVVPLDNRLLKLENKVFLDSIENITFGDSYQEESSFSFLINAYKTQVFFPEEDTVFSMSYDIQDTMIFSSQVQFPSYSYKLLKREDNLHLYHQMTDYLYLYSELKDTTDYFWVNYIGKFHDSNFYKSNNSNRLDTVSIEKKYVLLKTSHGVIQKYPDRYRWIYMNNGSLTGGPGKLRWASIKTVYQKDNYAFVIQEGIPDGYFRVFIVDLKKNKVLCYREEVENWCGLEPTFRESETKLYIDFKKEDQACTNDKEQTLVFDTKKLKRNIK